MRSQLIRGSASLAFFLVLGCGEQVVPSEPTATTTASSGLAPSLKTEVNRFEQPFGLFFGLGAGDESVAALLGISLEEFPAACAGTLNQDLADWMEVIHPSRQGGTSEHRLIKAKEMSALVWPVDIGPGGDVCDLTTQPFVGTVHLTVNDNEGDFFETAPGANAFTIHFVGTVTDQETGQRYHLQGALHLIAFQDGSVKELPVPFLRLTPIGG